MQNAAINQYIFIQATTDFLFSKFSIGNTKCIYHFGSHILT